MIKGKENFICFPEQMAVGLYAPFYLLLSISDVAPQKKREKKSKIDMKNIQMIFFVNIHCYQIKGREEMK